MWIQKDWQAEKLGRWIIENQGDGAEIYTVEIFGNPMMSIGEEVDVEYAERGLLPGKQRFVIESITNTVSSGHKTSIRIRRIFPKATQIRNAVIDWE